MPDRTGSSSNVPDRTGSSSNVPDRTDDSSTELPASDTSKGHPALATSTEFNTEASGSSTTSDRTCDVPDCGSWNRTFATLQYYRRHIK